MIQNALFKKAYDQNKDQDLGEERQLLIIDNNRAPADENLEGGAYPLVERTARTNGPPSGKRNREVSVAHPLHEGDVEGSPGVVPGACFSPLASPVFLTHLRAALKKDLFEVHLFKFK